MYPADQQCWRASLVPDDSVKGFAEEHFGYSRQDSCRTGHRF